jgi:putative chitinase
MNTHELDSYNLGDAVRFHRRLNPRIWGRDEHLLPEVREKLLAIAEDFQEFLGVEDLNIQDITVSGSNAAYSYTKNSDIDLHLVVTMPDDPVYQELFTAKKYQYNDEHNIKIGGADVELYVQPADQAHHSQGIYSVKDGKWIQVPQRKRAQIDDTCVRDKTADLDSRIHAAIKSRNVEVISTLWDKIKTMRKSGLEQHGEFGCENISFKLLRNSGCIKLLKDAMMAAQDRELSLREAPAKPFRYGYGADVDESSLADMRSAFATDPALKTTKQEIFHGPDEYEKVRKQREAERQEKIAKIARSPVKPWPMGVREGHQGQPYSSEDGVAASTKQFLENSQFDDNVVQDFIQHVTTELGIDPVPEIHLHTDPEWSTNNHSFGRYDPESHTLNVSMPNRHIMDVLRTVAHELVHCSQNQQHGQLPDDAGETGSRWENDANARAGIIMRDWANSHPEHFVHDSLEESASGYIPKNKKEAAMPQYAMALSVDIKPGQVGKEANKLGLKTGRNGEPGLLQPDAQNLLREFAEFVTEQEDLFEITMSPSSLKKLSAQTGALAGMEFEMCVPGAGDEDDGDQEPDYEYDERCRSIEDAVQFFHDGDWNGRRDVERMRDRMQNDYAEWLYERLDRDFVNESEYLISEWVANNVDESEWNPDDLEGEARQEALDEFISNVDADPSNDYYQKALDEYREEFRDSYDESDWLDAEDLDLMSGVENAYDVTWPHWRSTGGGETSIEDVADSFRDAVGRPILASTSYHSGRVERPSAKNLQYIVEPDSSIDVDDNNDQGLEFVSPPLPIEELLNDLNKVKAWADRTGCYTNDSTGLHINVSVPGWTQGTDQLDYVKLALLLGDEFVLDSFGRAGNTYAKSAMGKIRDAVRKSPDRAQELMDRMKSGMDQLASKVVHSRSTDKYTSINVKNGYIEFRSPGGDWLNDNFKEIDNTLRRFTVALSAAVDPEMYRQEYLKKLYKLLDVNSEKDPLSYFAKFAAGTGFSPTVLKSFIRQAQLERKVKRASTADATLPWRLRDTSTNEWATDSKGQGVYFDGTTRDDAMVRVKEYIQNQRNQGDTHNYWLEANPAVRPGQLPQGVDTRVDYELYSRASGAVIDTFPARNDDEAITRLQDYINFGAGQSSPDNFDVRRAPIAGSTLDLQRQRAAAGADAAQGGIIDVDIDLEPAPPPGGEFTGNWLIRAEDGTVLHRFGGIGNSQADANRTAQAWAQRNPDVMRQHPGGVDVVPEMNESLREYRMPQPSQGPGRYRDLNEPLGPETPPEMPAGTIKVDVSDMYDWYKLGQKISDLNSIKPGELGSGPPSTVFAFGSEDLENMYSHELTKLGLKTHDLDEPGEEDIDEGINENNQLTLRDFVVTISPHALSQAYNKGVDVHMVDDMLRNISKVKDNIMSLEPGRALILHNGQGTGLGVRRGQGNNLTLATVFPTSPGFTKGKHPTFQVEVNSTTKDVDEDISRRGFVRGVGAAAGLAATGAGAKQLQDYEPQQISHITQIVDAPDAFAAETQQLLHDKYVYNRLTKDAFLKMRALPDYDSVVELEQVFSKPMNSKVTLMFNHSDGRGHWVTPAIFDTIRKEIEAGQLLAKSKRPGGVPMAKDPLATDKLPNSMRQSAPPTPGEEQDRAYRGIGANQPTESLDEDWRSALATGAMAGAMAMGAQAKAPDMVQQIVEPGDTVYSIARQNNVNPLEIYKLNKMDRSTKLEVGQKVLVPDYSTPIKKLPATVTPTVKPPVAQAAPPAPSLKDKISSMIPKFSSDSKEEQGVTLLSNNPDAEAALQTAAKAAGLTGVELAQFMAQTRHESWDFGKMKEVGDKKQFAKYDAPRKAKQLGNKVHGDGELFKGRGFIQLTGRDNYTRASQQIFGDNRLIKNPDLASRLDVGAQIALWFWKNQVRPNVSNFNNTKEVTNAINPGLSGLQDRHAKFKEYMAVL